MIGPPPRLALALVLFGCAAPEPPPATARAVGVGEALEVTLRGAHLSLPAEAAQALRVRLEGPGVARLDLGGAGLGATEDALLDAAAEDLRALVPGAELRRAQVRWWGRQGGAVIAEDAETRRERRVLLRNPWRVATLNVSGPSTDLDGAEDPAIGLLGLALGGPAWRLVSARFEGPGYRLGLTRGSGACEPHSLEAGPFRLEGRAAPGATDEALERAWRGVRLEERD
ncbi:MAG: hypothetical protein AAGH15_07660 [Myxococcota bacterium]